MYTSLFAGISGKTSKVTSLFCRYQSVVKGLNGAKTVDLPEIERLITNAINNRPTITSAPVNLYIYKGKVVCGARVVMPEDAIFVSHVAPDKLENGFDNNEWKLIVRNAQKALNDTHTSEDNSSQRRTDFTERRREQRLPLRRPILFGNGRKQTLSQGRMVDIASGGIAFTICDKATPLVHGEKITTRFSVPYFGLDDSVQMHKFTRSGCICRISETSSFLKRVAVRFAQPLPFKPAEQSPNEIHAEDDTKTLSIF